MFINRGLHACRVASKPAHIDKNRLGINEAEIAMDTGIFIEHAFLAASDDDVEDRMQGALSANGISFAIKSSM